MAHHYNSQVLNKFYNGNFNEESVIKPININIIKFCFITMKVVLTKKQPYLPAIFSDISFSQHNTHNIRENCEVKIIFHCFTYTFLLLGAGHICTKDEECVEGAICQDPEEKAKGNGPAATYKTCQCLENLSSTPRGTCSGKTIIISVIF